VTVRWVSIRDSKRANMHQTNEYAVMKGSEQSDWVYKLAVDCQSCVRNYILEKSGILTAQLNCSGELRPPRTFKHSNFKFFHVEFCNRHRCISSKSNAGIDQSHENHDNASVVLT
jgi:hypothetical protein